MKIRKDDPERPYTCFVTRWDDNTFQVVVNSSSFDMPQHEAVKQPEYVRHVKEYKWYRGKITYREYSETKKGKP